MGKASETLSLFHFRVSKLDSRLSTLESRDTPPTHPLTTTHMSASAVFITDCRGKVLIWRNYRGDVPVNVAEKFLQRVLEDDESSLKPVMYDDGVTYLFIQHRDLYLMAVTKHNANAASVLLFLHKFVAVLEHYFKELEEESIRDNFVIIYELLDEVMDFGYPQMTEGRILAEYITQEGHKLEKEAKGPPVAVTNAVSWRSEGIKYRKNEVFLDVVESLDTVISPSGSVLRSEIVGAVKMRSFLSGMPELRLGLNDKLMFEAHGRNSGKGKSVELEDVKFHQCVRLSRFENDRTISFIPPDGAFELMSYRLSSHSVKPVILVQSIIEPHSQRVEYLIKAKSQFRARSTANNVEIHIPVPPDADSPKFKTTNGSVSYVAEKDMVVWTIKVFPAGQEFLLRAHFGLPSIQEDDTGRMSRLKAPISVKFEIPYMTVSGMQVRYLKIIEKSGYQALPWVRYITVNGDYQVRVS